MEFLISRKTNRIETNADLEFGERTGRLWGRGKGRKPPPLPFGSTAPAICGTIECNRIPPFSAMAGGASPVKQVGFWAVRNMEYLDRSFAK